MIEIQTLAQRRPAAPAARPSAPRGLASRVQSVPARAVRARRADSDHHTPLAMLSQARFELYSF
jgi:hypothetical protein